MRTTLTLDDDVAARLEREVRKRETSFKALVNDVLRAGFEVLDRRERGTRRRPFRTTGFDLGPSLVGSLDNVEEVLSRAEGEDHRCSSSTPTCWSMPPTTRLPSTTARASGWMPA